MVNLLHPVYADPWWSWSTEGTLLLEGRGFRGTDIGMLSSQVETVGVVVS
ncbi:hypothetical protein [Glutamicibacter endophyticus]